MRKDLYFSKKFWPDPCLKTRDLNLNLNLSLKNVNCLGIEENFETANWTSIGTQVTVLFVLRSKRKQEKRDEELSWKSIVTTLVTKSNTPHTNKTNYEQN